MSDILTTITKLINSPPGQLAAGGVLAGIVWKFFKNVGDVLNESTNREIARWIRTKAVESGLVSEDAAGWPRTFAKVFDRVFGQTHLSWTCFLRSCIASSMCVAITLAVFYMVRPLETVTPPTGQLRHYFLLGIVISLLPDYLALLETRVFMRFMSSRNSFGLHVVILVINVGITAYIAAALAGVAEYWASSRYGVTFAGGSGGSMDWSESLTTFTANLRPGAVVLVWKAATFYAIWLMPPFFVPGWLWLYAGSGFLLKAARRFDIGFEWFNRHFDIEKKPLQSIGLVAGALVAVVYWAAVIVSRVVG